MLASSSVLDYDSTAFLDRMPKKSRESILVNSKRVRYQAGAVAYHPGDGYRVEVLERGFTRIYLSSVEGRQTTLRYVRPGQLMGSLLVFGVQIDGSVQAVLDCSAIRLDIVHMRHQLEVDPRVGDALSMELACRLAHTVRLLALQTFGTIVQRIAFDLLHRSCRSQLMSGALEARVSHEEIANDIGSVRQVVSRGLAQLRDAGLIATSNRLVRILQPQRLEQLAQDAV